MRRREFITGLALPFLTRAAWAQKLRRVYRIAIVHPSNPVSELNEARSERYRAFFGELRRLGYVEGENLAVARYSGEGRPQGYAELAHDVVRTNPDVIMTTSSRMVLNFKAASSTIPIVANTSDPVALGIATSLARPGGNFTGVSVDTGPEVYGKRLELLKEVIPRLATVGFVATNTFWQSSLGLGARAAAEGMAIRLILGGLAGHEEVDYRNVFAAMAREPT
jgi:putative ABC transport system substrate-binding protein